VACRPDDRGVSGAFFPDQRLDGAGGSCPVDSSNEEAFSSRGASGNEGDALGVYAQPCCQQPGCGSVGPAVRGRLSHRHFERVAMTPGDTTVPGSGLKVDVYVGPIPGTDDHSGAPVVDAAEDVVFKFRAGSG
jgi:hypothetical protein